MIQNALKIGTKTFFLNASNIFVLYHEIIYLCFRDVCTWIMINNYFLIIDFLQAILKNRLFRLGRRDYVFFSTLNQKTFPGNTKIGLLFYWKRKVGIFPYISKNESMNSWSKYLFFATLSPPPPHTHTLYYEDE